MSYKALYRTYRPQVFSDVTGQEVVVKTLQNAIINNKISHAYLFCGPRGTGKTSVARIFAKALNCSNLLINEPCDECVSCTEISQGINPDVIEIDAASNNGVDEIRDIREKVKYLPSGSKYKIYIIDEVHMLSGGAFNALLKTLEEPPKHVIFILATTEPQKLPATIISRCQRFEFKALSVSEIGARLKQICDYENVSITEEAINAISENAEGAMRDAISILDQAISYGNKSIEIDDINGVTGSINFEKVVSLCNAIEGKDIHNTLETIHELIGSGKEISKIVNGLLVFYRDVLLYKSVGESGFDKFIFTKDKFKEFALNINISKIMYNIDVLCDVQSKVKFSTTPNIFLEIALIKMCNISVEELDIIKRVSELENKFNNFNDIDLSNIGNNNVNNEKVNNLDNRINQIVMELNRLELRKQIEKIDELKVIVNNINNNGVTNSLDREITSELQILKDKIEEIDLFVNKDDSNSNNDLIERIEALENKPEVNIVSNEKIDLTDVYSRIKQLEQSGIKTNSSANYEPKIEELETSVLEIMDDIHKIKEMLVNKENKQFESDYREYDVSEMSEKIMFLEKRIYQIVAGELGTKKLSKKEPKKNNGQIMLFGDDLLSINDFEEKTKEKYDFDDLEKEEKDQEISEESIKITEEELIQEEVVEEVIEQQEEVVEEFDEEAEDIYEVSNQNEEEIIEQQIDEEINYKQIVNNEIEEDSFIGNKLTLSDLRSEEVEEKIEQKPQVEQVNKHNLFDTASTIIERPVVEKKQNTVVSQYFDVNTGSEVINKEHSSIVIREKQEVEEGYSYEKDLINHENRYSDDFRQKEQPKEVENVSLFEKDEKDKFASYNIKYIEQILHDSRAMESRNDKVRIEQVWKAMTRGARPEHLSIIETLQSGKVAVVGNKEFIIVFPSVNLCNIVMRPRFKDVAIRILYNLLGDKYNYIALPIDVWTSKSVEYKQQYQIGIKFPTLTPLNVPGLEVIEEEYETDTDKVINRTLKMFGKDNVEIE